MTNGTRVGLHLTSDMGEDKRRICLLPQSEVLSEVGATKTGLFYLLA